MTRNQIYPRLIAFLLFVLALLTGAPAAFAQPASGDTEAVLVSRLSLVPVRDLNFGNLIPGATGGTAVISPAGSRTVSGSVVAAGGPASNAEFQGYGSRNRFIYISTASSSYRLDRVGGGANMTLRSLTLQADNLTPLNFPGLFRIASTNVITLRIGGTLDIGANQQAGVYAASFPITMNYY